MIYRIQRANITVRVASDGATDIFGLFFGVFFFFFFLFFFFFFFFFTSSSSMQFRQPKPLAKITIGNCGFFSNVSVAIMFQIHLPWTHLACSRVCRGPRSGPRRSLCGMTPEREVGQRSEASIRSALIERMRMDSLWTRSICSVKEVCCCGSIPKGKHECGRSDLKHSMLWLLERSRRRTERCARESRRLVELCAAGAERQRRRHCDAAERHISPATRAF
jgi:hypothetical protein